MTRRSWLLFALWACSPNPDAGFTPNASGFGGSAGSGAAAGAAGSSASGTGGISIAVDGGGGAASGCGPKDVSVLFVIDRSASMKCNLPPTTTSEDCERMPARVNANLSSKWEVVTAVLSDAFQQLIPTSAGLKVSAGLSLFSVDDVCGARSQPSIPITPVTSSHVDLLRQSLSITPAGGTPVVGATILAYKHIYQPTFTGDGHVILLTDGADSCKAAYDTTVGPADHIAGLIDIEAPKALAVGIKTWVIGAPGSEPARHMLSSLALSGGTARKGCNPGTDSDPASGNCHYDMTTSDFQRALEEALTQIVSVVTCQPPK